MFTKVITRVLLRIARILRKRRGWRFADSVEKISDQFHRELNNVNFNMNTNGEQRVLEVISAFKPTIIFDVGANIGEWSKIMAVMNPQSKIHAFELVPATFKKLVVALSEHSNVIANNFGLSNDTGTIAINLGADSDQATAFKIEGMKFHNEYYKETIQCSVQKASDYIRNRGITQIDFVKIDVEGMDLRVIKGFEDMLGIVRVLQFEYGIFNVSSHDLLADFCSYLAQRGFVVGKVFPQSVQFFEYDCALENFHGSNFIAVKKEDSEMIRRLSGKV